MYEMRHHSVKKIELHVPVGQRETPRGKCLASFGREPLGRKANRYAREL
jgi:hypothetical protein